MGDRCQEECPIGTYGFQCTQKCDCQNGAKCYHVNGACMCDPGFKGIRCQERMCPEGLYGLKCHKKCPCNITNTLSCHPLSGECTCKAGSAGLYCNDTCPPGYYGEGCQLTCLCQNGADCGSVTGKCTCAPGFMGGDCSITCGAGTYGANCSSVCNCKNDGACSPVDGLCLCREGWQGVDCSIPCPSGTWGLNCNQTCYCANGAACNPVDGFCLCSPGWQGEYCDQACPMGAMPSLVIVAVLLGGQASIVITYAHRAAGDQTAPSLVTVRTGDPVRRRMGLASVRQDIEDSCAREFVHLAFMGIIAVKHVPHVCTAAGLVTMSLDVVIVCLDSLAHSATKCVLVEDMGRTVLRSVNVPTTAHAILLMELVSVFRGGLGKTALRLVQRVFGDQIAFTHATATTEQCATLTMENVDVLLAGLGSTVLSVAQRPFMEEIVPMFVSVRMEQIVTTSLGNAHAELDLQANSVSKSVHLDHLGFKGIRCDQAALMMEELNPYTKISPALGSERHSVGAITGIIILLLIIMVLLALFVWYRRKQKEKGHDMPSVSYTPAMRMTNTDYSLSDVSQGSSSVHCFSNPSYHTLSCGVTSRFFTNNLDGNSSSKLSNKVPDRETADRRPYSYLNELGACGMDRRQNTYIMEKSFKEYMKESVCSSSTCSLNSSENPYATIKDPPILTCKHSESSYVEMKSPIHRDSPYSELPTSSKTNKNIYEVEPTVSVVQEARGRSVNYNQNPYDLPRNSHIPSHYDLLPVRHSPTHGASWDKQS
ncbi:unnamed protein product [Caretta caretta]